MKRTTQLSAELRALCTLCDPAMSGKLRQNLLASLEGHKFLEPESQAIFESIRALAGSGPISRERLAQHLNNRGFPDIDIERYFLADGMNSESPDSTTKNHA